LNPLANPFDMLPPGLFNILGSQGGLQRHYLAILLRIYELAEFNRFGLTRDIVVADIAQYLTGPDAQGWAAAAQSASSGVDDDPLTPGDVQEQARWFLR
jgi:hypothetical protein